MPQGKNIWKKGNWIPLLKKKQFYSQQMNQLIDRRLASIINYNRTDSVSISPTSLTLLPSVWFDSDSWEKKLSLFGNLFKKLLKKCDKVWKKYHVYICYMNHNSKCIHYVLPDFITKDDNFVEFSSGLLFQTVSMVTRMTI